MNKLILVFDKTNNFDIIDEKNNTKENLVSIGRNIDWLLNCALSGISSAYKEGAPRRIEMEQMCADLKIQLKSQLLPEQIEKLKL